MVSALLFCSLPTGCLTVPENPSCTTGNTPIPRWVYTGGEDKTLSGHYVGVGQAEYIPDNPYLQMQLARRRALSQLTQGILVTVESSMELVESMGIDRATTRRTATRRLKVASRLTLRDVIQDASYQDPDTCTLWVRVKIARAVANNFIALEQAAGLYQLSIDDTGATPAQRLRWVTKAKEKLGSMDNSALTQGTDEKLLLAARIAEREETLRRHRETTCG